jgi:hypothetical protein
MPEIHSPRVIASQRQPAGPTRLGRLCEVSRAGGVGYRREEVVAELAEAGWTLASESDVLPYQYFLIFKPATR